jgi:hypothetical protein
MFCTGIDVCLNAGGDFVTPKCLQRGIFRSNDPGNWDEVANIFRTTVFLNQVIFTRALFIFFKGFCKIIVQRNSACTFQQKKY